MSGDIGSSEERGCFKKTNKRCKSLNKRKQVKDLTAQLSPTQLPVAHVNILTELSMRESYTAHQRRDTCRTFYSLVLVFSFLRQWGFVQSEQPASCSSPLLQLPGKQKSQPSSWAFRDVSLFCCMLFCGVGAPWLCSSSAMDPQKPNNPLPPCLIWS